jgi:hypothetical protein
VTGGGLSCHPSSPSTLSVEVSPCQPVHPRRPPSQKVFTAVFRSCRPSSSLKSLLPWFSFVPHALPLIFVDELISLFRQGFFLSQCVSYFRLFPQDRWHWKTLVAGLLCLELGYFSVSMSVRLPFPPPPHPLDHPPSFLLSQLKDSELAKPDSTEAHLTFSSLCFFRSSMTSSWTFSTRIRLVKDR